MWSNEHLGESTASVERIFALFEDVHTWSEWNAGVERMELNGPFAAGAAGTMVVTGQGPLDFRLVWVDENEGFEDETQIPDGDVVVRVHHSLQPLPQGGTRISYRCVIDGPAADAIGPTIGPAITGDFPDVIAALAARAEATDRQ